MQPSHFFNRRRSRIRSWVRIFGLGTVLSFLSVSGLSAETLKSALEESRILFDARLRFEFADQDGFAPDARALTGRARFGIETGTYRGLSILAEGDLTRDLVVNNFNSTINGKTRFPVIADPDSERLNRLYLNYRTDWNNGSGIARLGRQRIILDNHRFVGNVGFRQNEQTYDAVRFQISAIDQLQLDYTYLWHVNRIFGSNSAIGEADADTHLLNARYQLSGVNITTYAYLMDLKGPLSGASNQTYGARLSGNLAVSQDWRLLYEAEFAHQSDFGGNQADFGLDYFAVNGGIGRGGLTLRAGAEILEGNGSRGFATPLATLHKFQGFADLFLVTPASGIQDLSVMADYRLTNLPMLGNVRLAAWFHDFSAERGPGDLGEEIDWGIFVTPRQGVTVSLEFASFFGSDSRGDLNRLWATLAFQY